MFHLPSIRRIRSYKLRANNFILAACIGAAVVLAGLMVVHEGPAPVSASKQPAVEKAFVSASVQEHSKSSQGSAPQLIMIPKLKQSIPFTSVGLTGNGEMAIPHDLSYAGWFKQGVRPGEVGSAVIDGHNQIANKGDGVFANIHTLTSGDSIYVQDGSRPVQHFVVMSSETYDPAKAPMGHIFGAADKAHLNLITCAGKWNKSLASYTERLVVYADLVQ